MNRFILWSKNLWGSIKPNGVWGVPRSGLLFRRTNQGFVLCDVARPVVEGFREYQREDFACIAEHMAQAGLKVSDPENLLGLEVPNAHS